MNYHKDNCDILDSIVKNINSIVPFVGAGLSAFAYPDWREFLKDVFEKLNRPGERDYFNKMLREYRYEEAASFLENERGRADFNEDIRKIFAIDKLDEISTKSRLHKEALYLLPLLFKGLVLTTNFDQVLERIYEDNKTPFIEKGHPEYTEMLNRALRTENQTTLFKFHGDTSEVSSLVLTKEKYDKLYKPDSELVKELKKCFKQKIILFLGCSLNKDRTMTVFEQALEKGAVNYAIIGCKPENRGETSRELGDRSIRAILYPFQHHESVRIILESLLAAVNKDEFDRLDYFASKNPA
jgi:NAD-dependent SIR2 family protein deacetylase